LSATLRRYRRHLQWYLEVQKLCIVVNTDNGALHCTENADHLQHLATYAAVQRRAVRAAERWRQATDVGEWLTLVTHADLVKMIVGHYLGIPLVNCPLMNMDNASVSLLTFHPDPKELPSLLCFNWTSPAV
jgi:broad specificity phosphatase PhoE